jgi:23S rRNA (guanosine2251-2'-O)-methyltransferase
MEREVMAAKSKRLKGKGPTPKAKDRPYHKAAKAAKLAKSGRPARASTSGRATTSGRPSAGSRDSAVTTDRSGRGERAGAKSGFRSGSKTDFRSGSKTGSKPGERSRTSGGGSRSGARKPTGDKTRGYRNERGGAARRERITTVDTIAGRNAVVEALRAHIPAKELIVAIGLDIDDRVTEIVALAEELGIAIREIPRGKVEALTGIANHQGVALIAKPFQYSSQKEIFQRAKSPALIIAVDGVTDPRNIGAIVRSAAAFGADGVLIPERRSASMTASAWKASAGAAARLPIAQITNVVRSIEDAKAKGCFVIGLDGESEDLIADLKVATEPLYIVVGSEGKGISRLVREHCDVIVSIPTTSTVESLNASVAVSIALYSISEARK